MTQLLRESLALRPDYPGCECSLAPPIFGAFFYPTSSANRFLHQCLSTDIPSSTNHAAWDYRFGRNRFLFSNIAVRAAKNLSSNFRTTALSFVPCSLIPSGQRRQYKQKYTSTESLTAAIRRQFSANQLRGTIRRRRDLSASEAATILSLVFDSPSAANSTSHDESVNRTQPRRGVKRPRSSSERFPAGARDPITLEPLADSSHVFTYKRSAESVGAFDLPTLVQYLVATGDFRDPETRVPFPSQVLAKLDKAAIAAGLPSPLGARAHKADTYKDQDTTLMAITGVERLAHDFLSESMELLEQQPFNPGHTQVSIGPWQAYGMLRTTVSDCLQSKWQLELFPQLCNVLEQMAGLDKGACGSRSSKLHPPSHHSSLPVQITHWTRYT